MTAPSDLERARADAEAQLRGLRYRLRSSAGLEPRRRGWWVLLLAGAVGLALGSRARSRRAPGTTERPRDASDSARQRDPGGRS